MNRGFLEVHAVTHTSGWQTAGYPKKKGGTHSVIPTSSSYLIEPQLKVLNAGIVDVPEIHVVTEPVCFARFKSC